MLALKNLYQGATSTNGLKICGRLVAVRSGTLVAELPHAALGDLCQVEKRGGLLLDAQVVGFRETEVLLAPFGDLQGLHPGCSICNTGIGAQINISEALLGQIVDCLARPLNSTSIIGPNMAPLQAAAPNPLSRKKVDEQLVTGIRSIDGLLPIGYGQRIGLFAPPGAGKSTLLGIIAKQSAADICVVALVGERGREVTEFVNEALGLEGLKKSVVVVATSDEPAIRRSLAALTATAIAEYFRAQGKRVLLLVDSLTRMARAIREVSLAAGEMPVRQGYTASVYAELPKLLERAGNDQDGSITAIYTVLTNAEESIDPLAEEARSLLDGHITLSTILAERGHFPAIDVSTSISRLSAKLHQPKTLLHAASVKSAISRLKRDKELVILGGRPDSELAQALKLETQLNRFLQQAADEFTEYQETIATLHQLADQLQSIS